MHCAVNYKIVTIDNLIWRRMVMVNQFCVCLRDEESVMHLFIYCLVAKELWNAVLVLWGILWVSLLRWWSLFKNGTGLEWIEEDGSCGL